MLRIHLYVPNEWICCGKHAGDIVHTMLNHNDNLITEATEIVLTEPYVEYVWKSHEQHLGYRPVPHGQHYDE